MYVGEAMMAMREWVSEWENGNENGNRREEGGESKTKRIWTKRVFGQRGS